MVETYRKPKKLPTPENNKNLTTFRSFYQNLSDGIYENGRESKDFSQNRLNLSPHASPIISSLPHFPHTTKRRKYRLFTCRESKYFRTNLLRNPSVGNESISELVIFALRHQMKHPNISVFQVYNLLMKIDCKKTTEPHGIPALVVKNFSRE